MSGIHENKKKGGGRGGKRSLKREEKLQSTLKDLPDDVVSRAPKKGEGGACMNRK